MDVQKCQSQTKKEEHMITPQIREDTGEGNTMAEHFLAEWGTASLFVNGRPEQCTVKNLPCRTEQFCVKGRVCLSCRIPKSVHSEETSIKCRVLFHDASDVEPCEETGEELALVSYYLHNYKISVGTLGDQKDTRYLYTSDGLEIITKCTINRVEFYIAWVEMSENKVEKERQEIYTWLAADPSYHKSKVPDVFCSEEES